MKNKEQIVLVGGGEHCKVVIDALKNSNIYDIIGITDEQTIEKNILGIDVIGSDNDLEGIRETGCNNAFITLGSIGDPSIRIKIYEKLKNLGYSLPVIAHPSAIIGSEVIIKEGTYISAGVVINPGSIIGINSIINTNCSIDHDCNIGSFVHVAPGATLSGGVVVGDRSHIGTNAAVVEHKNIGADTIIGAGSVIVSDIPNNCIAFGNPCKVVRVNHHDR